MSDDEKPGWFGRLFGRKGAPESKSPEPVPAEDAAAEETPAGESVTPDPLSPASESEGQPVFTTAADDVAHVPPAVSEPAPDDPDKNRIPDENWRALTSSPSRSRHPAKHRSPTRFRPRASRRLPPPSRQRSGTGGRA